MNKQAILHIPMSQYAYGLDDRHIVFRLRSAAGDLLQCRLIYGDRSCRRTPVDYYAAEMPVIASDTLFDWREVTLETSFTRICYAFELVDKEGNLEYYYGDLFHAGLTDDRSAYFQLPFNHRADRLNIPDWMQDAIVYNIFPDSFASGRRTISGKAEDLLFQGKHVRGKLGGTVRGATANLDYLKDLGVNCIYFNPIFAAGEYHKYDLIDYYHIDPVFGTDDEFRLLVQKAHSLGIRVMIDGVFNHCGWHFFAFEDVVRNGKASPYWNWFYDLQEPVIIPDDMADYPNYACFGYERMMPKLACDHPAVIEYFCQVGSWWVSRFDIDGWRLDVASEVNDAFWRAFRKAVKAVKPDCALIGEVWESAGHWLDGSMFDSTMNYDFRKHAAAFFAGDNADAKAFNHRVTDMLMRYRRPVTYAELNLLDSHDVSRFLSLCGNDLRKMKLAVLFQMTFVGMPCIFYGDELGMTGFSEEEYRHPMEWENTSHPLHEFYRKSIALRKRYPALRRGAFAQEASDDYVFRYSRILDEEKITVILNRSDTVVSFMPCKEFLWKSGEQNAILEPYGFVVMKG